MTVKNNLQSDFKLLVEKLEALTATANYETTQANNHFMALWCRTLNLCDSLSLLVQYEDAVAANLVLRSQLEIFARLEFFLFDPVEAWKTERANEIKQLRLTKKHYDKYPTSVYSLDTSGAIASLESISTDLTKSTTKHKEYEEEKTVRSIFDTNAKHNATDMSAYGYYQELCLDTHSSLTRTSARHRVLNTATAPPNLTQNQFAGECDAQLLMSAWLLFRIAERTFDWLTDPQQSKLKFEILELYKRIQAPA